MKAITRHVDWFIARMVLAVALACLSPNPGAAGGCTPKLAVVFCGSKKSLASGIPMARLIFSGYPGLSMILLPIMIYHPLQLLCGPLANIWARQQAAGLQN